MTKFTYEEGMEKLEALVNALESGNMKLEESFEAYREATELYKKLQKMLDEGEARIIEIMNAGEKDITDEVNG